MRSQNNRRLLSLHHTGQFFGEQVREVTHESGLFISMSMLNLWAGKPMSVRTAKCESERFEAAHEGDWLANLRGRPR